MQMGMWQVELDPNSSTSGCFVGPENLRPLDPSEDPYV